LHQGQFSTRNRLPRFGGRRMTGQTRTLPDMSRVFRTGKGRTGTDNTGIPPLGGFRCPGLSITPICRTRHGDYAPFAGHRAFVQQCLTPSRSCSRSTQNREPTGPSPAMAHAGDAERDVSLNSRILKLVTRYHMGIEYRQT
jgi:hypothetical protein